MRINGTTQSGKSQSDEDYFRVFIPPNANYQRNKFVTVIGQWWRTKRELLDFLRVAGGFSDEGREEI